MPAYYPGLELDAIEYVKIQQERERLLQQLRDQDPTLFPQMMRAGMFAVLGGIGADMINQSPVKGAIAGAIMSMLFPKQPHPKPMPPEPTFPPLR